MQEISLIINDDGYAIHPKDLFFFDGVFVCTYKFGEFLVDFLEMNVSDALFVISDQEMNETDSFVQMFLYDCQIQLSSKYNPILTALLLNEVERVLVAFNSEEIDQAEANEELKGRLENIVLIQRLVKIFLQKKGVGNYSEIFSLQSIQTRFYYDYEKSKMSLLMELQDIISLIALEIVHVQKHKIIINKCQNCHRYFLPDKRSDEIYCSRVFENKKTCKQIGYENTMDEFQRCYRKEYKTQHRRIAYNQENIRDYRERYFEPWVEDAQRALKEYKQKNDLEGFKQWLNDNHNIV